MFTQGNRLGSAADNFNTSAAHHGRENKATTCSNNKNYEDQPYIDPNIDDDERQQRRAEREAAAKLRIQKNTGKVTKKKRANTSSQPLRGPNSKNTMTWTM